MTIRSRQFAGPRSAIVLGALVLAVQSTPLYAADECLSGPKGAAPIGSHWYYRIDRATKKNCWYVRAERKPTPATAVSEGRALPRAETPLQPSVANARAEADPALIEQPKLAVPEPAPFAGAASIAEPSAAADDSQSPVASRWGDQPAAGTTSTLSQQPAVATANPEIRSAASAPPAASDLRVTSSGAGFPPLLLVILGALAAAAGVTGLMLRLRRANVEESHQFDSRQQAPWDVMDIGETIQSPPLATEPAPPQREAASDQHAAVIPDEIVQLLSTLSKEAPA